MKSNQHEMHLHSLDNRYIQTCFTQLEVRVLLYEDEEGWTRERTWTAITSLMLGSGDVYTRLESTLLTSEGCPKNTISRSMLPSPSQVEYRVANVGDAVGVFSVEEEIEDSDDVVAAAAAAFSLLRTCLLVGVRRVTCAKRL